MQNCKIQIPTKTLLVILLFMFPLFINAQEKETSNGKKYKIKVKCSDKVTVKGFLYMVMDSAVVVAARVSKHPVLDTISPNYIRKIKLTRRGNGPGGFAIGALASIVTGIIISTGETPETNPGSYAIAKTGDIAVGIVLAIPAGIVGAVVANNIGNHYTINYDYNNFQLYKSELVKRAYHQSSLTAK